MYLWTKDFLKQLIWPFDHSENERKQTCLKTFACGQSLRRKGGNGATKNKPKSMRKPQHYTTLAKDYNSTQSRLTESQPSQKNWSTADLLAIPLFWLSFWLHGRELLLGRTYLDTTRRNLRSSSISDRLWFQPFRDVIPHLRFQTYLLPQPCHLST